MAAWLFVLTGAAFVIYPAARPFAPGGAADGTAEFASNWWLVAHLSAVVGFIAFVGALFALRELLRETEGARAAAGALVSTWLGVGLTLPYYGAETFALHTLGRSTLNDRTALDLAEQIRMGGTAATTFAAGLALIGIGAVVAAVAIAKSRLFERWAGIPMALGFVLLIPQFYVAAPLRIAHGVLVGLGCVLVAVALLRERRAPGVRRSPPVQSPRSTMTGA
ncbi:MAG: hypothetical protein WAW17_05000 [Rhodococcus sp. (in: high G+C Gram-positive bacteria)]|uniref:hypothetical protein n=1 Tax=Rhodococcus sp. TaxID=1831 RepID=UPI003BAEFEB3